MLCRVEGVLGESLVREMRANWLLFLCSSRCRGSVVYTCVLLETVFSVLRLQADVAHKTLKRAGILRGPRSPACVLGRLSLSASTVSEETRIPFVTSSRLSRWHRPGKHSIDLLAVQPLAVRRVSLSCSRDTLLLTCEACRNAACVDADQLRDKSKPAKTAT